MTDTVLVTGISSFLGGHVALQLLARGYRVRGSLRSLARADRVRATLSAHGGDTSRLEFVALELEREAGWAEAMAGIRYLQHIASPVVLDQPRERDELIRPALAGTRHALGAALAAGVERVVLTSSIAAIVYGHEDGARPFTTADWTDPGSRRTSAYAESKLRAEREAWSMMAAAGTPDRLAVINPGAILGPLLDDDPGASGALLLRLLDGSVPAVPRLTISVVDVRDVAAAQLAAMESPAAGGRRHILANGEMSILDLARLIRARLPDAAGRVPRHAVPDWVVRLAGLFDARIRGHLHELGNVRPVDGGSGRDLLGRPMISAADATLAMAESLVAHGLVR